MIYNLVQFVEGKLVASQFSEANVIPAMSARGFEFNGANANSRQRAELQGQPKFKGVCGPMYDGIDTATGEAIIRYECPEANDILSR
jgi:hypothetical protein